MVAREFRGYAVVQRNPRSRVYERGRCSAKREVGAHHVHSPSRLELTFDRNERDVASRRLVAVAMSRLPEADPPGVLLVGRDVTAERETRVRLMETDRLAAIGELVAGVAQCRNKSWST